MKVQMFTTQRVNVILNERSGKFYAGYDFAKATTTKRLDLCNVED